MIIHQHLKVLFFVAIFNFSRINAQNGPPRPKIPDVFQVEVQGIFEDESTEVDASLFYDRINNRAVLAYTFQNETTNTIYDFDKNQLIYIYGVECSVSNISDQTGSFFQYTIDEDTNKTVIGSPEEVLFFTKSEFERQDLMILPSIVYTSTQDFPLYGLANCTISHVFSKPELELSDCESHSCRSTLVSISVSCPPETNITDGINHIYNFYRFRSTIKDESIFQPPVGVHCQVLGQKPFPEFPKYYSFSYDLIKELKDPDHTVGVYTTHKRIWHNTKLKLIRMDEFDKEGLLEATRIIDFYGETAYTIIADLPVCSSENDFRETIHLGKMTLLPEIFFSPNETDGVVYIGKRTVHGLEFEVWTQSIDDEETEAKVVYEFYFTNNIQDAPQNVNSSLQLSHVDIYTYEMDDFTHKYKLSLLTYLSITNFRTKPEEWEAFDISSCFSGEERRGFRLKVEGPPLIRNSYMYEEVLEKLYIKLIKLTNVSVIRISQLKGTFNGTSIIEFTGWILQKVESEGSKLKNLEPNIAETYDLIEKAAAVGVLTLHVKKGNADQIYKITSVSELIIVPSSCISGGTLAAVAIILLLMGITFGVVGFYVFLKKRTPESKDQIQLQKY